jgi:hypothetical protein
MVRIWLAMLVGTAILVGSGVVASLARAQSQSPAAVIGAYEAARNRRDVDAALSYFADDATVNQRNTTFTGRDDIRKFLDGFASRGRFAVVQDRNVNGTHVTWTERSGGQIGGQPGQTPNVLGNGGINPNAFVVTVDAVVQDGKIRSLTYSAGNQLARPDPGFDGRAQLPAPIGLGAVLSVFAAMVMLGSMGLRRGAVGASTLRGRLMRDLQGWSAARQSL